MSFIWPVLLYSLLLLPLFILLYLRGQGRRREMASALDGFGLARQASGPIGRRRHIPPILFISGMAVLLLSLARPQATLSLPRLEGTLILAFDVSGSMAADDLQPTRMEAAKEAARGFVGQQPSNILIGVVAFSDGGLSVQTPTDDREAVLGAIDRLNPERGTSLASGILAALDLISPDTGQSLSGTPAPTPTPVPHGTHIPASIVLLTDGENNLNPDPLAAALTAVERGVRIYTIGIGSPEGVVIEVEGFSVHTRLDESLLQQISVVTGGTYYNAQNEEELNSIYDALEPQLVVKTEEMEVTSLFAGASILLLLAGGMFSLLWFGRVP
jgi:Ca-activated chloride channel family protein